MRRISKRTREQAALICAIAASNAPHLFYLAEETLGITVNYRPGRLAREAYFAASEVDARVRQNVEIIAEAEALLRTGWSP